MPLPRQFRFSSPSVTPITPTDHARNYIAIEQTFDKLPLFPDYVMSSYVDGATITGSGWTLTGIFDGTAARDKMFISKIYDQTDLIVAFGMTATANAAGVAGLFRMRLYERDNPTRFIDPLEQIGNVYVNPANAYNTSVTWARIKNIPANNYRVRILGRPSVAAQTVTWNTGCMKTMTITETALGLDLPGSRTIP